MASKRFANYPQPIDRSRDESGDVSKDDNPVMKGIALSIGASLYVFFPLLPPFFLAHSWLRPRS